MPHFLKRSNRVAFNVGAIEGIDGDEGDLRVRLLVDLAADVVDLRGRAGIENVREIVDVTRRLKL